MSRAEKQPLFDECGPFAVVPKWLLLTPGLTDRALRLYVVLWTYTTQGNRTAFPSRRTIAAKMGCGVKKADQAIAELVSVGGLLVRQQFSSAGDRTSNLYELVRAPGGWISCEECGRCRAAGCVCSPPGPHTDPTGGASGYQGGLQMEKAEEEPLKVELSKESHLRLSDDSQESSPREAKVRGTRNLPFSADIILELMGQMSWECYHMGLEEITDSAFVDVKKYTLDIARSMSRCEMQPDPVYIHGFAHHYSVLGFSFVRPAPKSYADHWNKVDWSEIYLRQHMDLWREVEDQEPERPHVMDARSGYLTL